jgi:hypothetical protein
MEEVKKTNKGKGAADRMLMDLHFDAMDKDHSGGIDIEEFIAGYNSLFHEERHELALKLHAQHPGALLVVPSSPCGCVGWRGG